ncbi:MAG: ABC transporter permease [Ignavibacteria bacterium]|nr:ABC transporter permease [Ignavibacteria bacterium]
MDIIIKIFLYQVKNLLRSRWLAIYTLFFFILTYVLAQFTADSSKVILSMLSLVLLVIPLVSIIFGSVIFYNSREFITFMLSQPLLRYQIFLGIALGVAIPLAFSFIVGISLPLLLFQSNLIGNLKVLILILSSGFFLTFIFTFLAFLISVLNDDKARGLGISFGIWLVLAVIYDGILLLLLYFFNEYPLEVFTLVLSLFNPIDLSRIFVLLEFDNAVLLGYTGAVFNNFFGSSLGQIITLISFFVWTIIPLILANRIFSKKDF